MGGLFIWPGMSRFYPKNLVVENPNTDTNISSHSYSYLVSGMNEITVNAVTFLEFPFSFAVFEVHQIVSSKILMSHSA